MGATQPGRLTDMGVRRWLLMTQEEERTVKKWASEG
jgi:hypothetical protein